MLFITYYVSPGWENHTSSTNRVEAFLQVIHGSLRASTGFHVWQTQTQTGTWKYIRLLGVLSVRSEPWVSVENGPSMDAADASSIHVPFRWCLPFPFRR